MTPQELSDIAVSYINRGWSVIPVGAEKRPMINWRDYQDTIAEVDRVKQWFSTPDVQIGIVTGKVSNLTVVDLEYGADASLFKDVETYIVKTGGGGFHYYFQYEEEVKNSVRILPLTDTRSEGGYVVAAGSESTKGPYVVVNEAPVAKMPDYIKRKLIPGYIATSTVGEAQSSPSYPTEALLDYPGYGEGQRNDEMTRFTGAILCRTHPSLWSTVAWGALVEANKRNTPPLTDYELQSIFNSISARESTKPRSGYDIIGMGEQVETIEPLPTPEQVDERVGHVFEVAERQPIDTDESYKTNLSVFDEALGGGIAIGDLILIVGRTGEGKTSFAQDLTVSFVKGSPSAPGLWFSFEVLPRPLANKFKELGLTSADPVYMPYTIEEDNTEWIAKLAAATRAAKGVKVVVIDHLGFITSKKTNKNMNQSAVITQTARDLKRLAVQHGMVVILLAHIRKTFSKVPTLEDVKDSSGPAQEADAVFIIDRLKNAADRGMSNYFQGETRITLAKNRRTGITPSILCQYQNGRFVTNEGLQNKFNEYERMGKEAEDLWDSVPYGDKSDSGD